MIILSTIMITFNNVHFIIILVPKLLFAKDGIEVIYDDHSEIENVEALHFQVMVMSGPHVVNSHNQSLFQYVGCPFNDHTTIYSHLEYSHNDFNFQEINSIIIYHFDLTTLVPISSHNIEILTQVDASFTTDHII